MMATKAPPVTRHVKSSGSRPKIHYRQDGAARMLGVDCGRRRLGDGGPKVDGGRGRWMGGEGERRLMSA